MPDNYDDIQGFGGDVLRELAAFMLGDKLGRGMSRSVFNHPHDPTKVIKVENSASNFQNVKEWELWQEVRYMKGIARWLAPCHYISYSGTFLVMEKTADLSPKQIPKKLPAFLTDHKAENFGTINGRVVCRDYGHINYEIRTAQKNWRGEK